MSSTSHPTSSASSIYFPLPSPTSIRLVKLNGYTTHAERKDERLIDISLETVDVKTSPSYNALSYTWGDPLCRDLDPSLLPPISDGPHELCCNGVIISVQPNLLDALKTILSIDLDETDRNSQEGANDGLSLSSYLWIDALCINQTDPDEIAAQVSIMGSIYLRAEKVIAWLGPEDTTIPNALSVLDRLAFLGKDTIDRDFDEESALLSHIDERMFLRTEEHKEKLGIEPIHLDQWLCFVAFLSRPYFSRTWIVQEVTLARSIVPLCGKRLVDWDKIRAASLFLHYTNWGHFLDYSAILSISTVETRPVGFETFLKSVTKTPFLLMGLIISKMEFRTTNWSDLRRSGNLPGTWTFDLACAINLRMEAISLFELLEIHRPCLASDPRDKVYGLLGISGVKRSPFADMTQVLEGSIPRLIKVDYKATVEEVYTRASRAIIAETGDLEVLRTREDNDIRVRKSLPSWVPDFSIGLLPVRLGMAVSFSAGGEARCDISPSDGDTDPPGVLPVKGICLGTITDYTPRQSSVKDYYTYAAQLARTLPPYYAENPALVWKTEETRAEVLARTCLVNTFDGAHEIPTQSLSPDLVSEFLHHIADIISSTELTITTTEEDGQVVENIVPVRLKANKQIIHPAPPPSPPPTLDTNLKTQRSYSLPNLDLLSLRDHAQQSPSSSQFQNLPSPVPPSAISPHPQSAIIPNDTPFTPFASIPPTSNVNKISINTPRSPREIIVVDDPEYGIPAQEALHEYLLSNPLFQLILDEPEDSPYSLSALSEAMTRVSETVASGIEGEGATSQDEGYFGRVGPGAKYRTAADWYTVGGSRRVFIVTDSASGLGSEGGKLIGIGRLSAEIGDEVWVLEGGKTPFVLRRKGVTPTAENAGQSGEGLQEEGLEEKKGDGEESGERLARYEFIGSAYVHGVMHGEAFETKKEVMKILLE